ncbi:MAG TPA: hypothetical protein VEU77_00130 [Candidatus Acidoferrales bacterium]|nr:hypothetical protein [Candidatus Acidoferrales bacterium]
MTDARATSRMDDIRWIFAVIARTIARAVAWSVASVEDEPHVSNVIPMPGPAHGPVPAIELRLEEQHRKAS